MSNLRNAPLFLTPQVTRDILGEGRARNMAEIEVVSLTDLGNRCSELRLQIMRAIHTYAPRNALLSNVAKQCRISPAALREHLQSLTECGCVTQFAGVRLTAKGASKVVGSGKPMPNIGFIAVRRDGALSPMMTASEFIKDKTPRAGFWRVRAKTKTEIAVVTPPPPQGRDGDLSSPDPVVVPAITPSKLDKKARNDAIVAAYLAGDLLGAITEKYGISDGTVYYALAKAGISPKRNSETQVKVQVEATSETPPSPEPAAKQARVAAPVPVTSKTAGTGANILVTESDDTTPRRNASPMLPVHLPENGSGPALPFERTPEPAVAKPKPAAPIGSNWIAQRFERFAAAVAYLKTHNVGVQVVNKDADIKKYRVSSHGFATFFHEEVLEIAMDKGWAG